MENEFLIPLMFVLVAISIGLNIFLFICLKSHSKRDVKELKEEILAVRNMKYMNRSEIYNFIKSYQTYLKHYYSSLHRSLLMSKYEQLVEALRALKDCSSEVANSEAPELIQRMDDCLRSVELKVELGDKRTYQIYGGNPYFDYDFERAKEKGTSLYRGSISEDVFQKYLMLEFKRVKLLGERLKR